MPDVPVVVSTHYHAFVLLDSSSSSPICVKGMKDKLCMKGKRVRYDICTLNEAVSKMPEAVESLGDTGMIYDTCPMFMSLMKFQSRHLPLEPGVTVTYRVFL